MSINVTCAFDDCTLIAVWLSIYSRRVFVVCITIEIWLTINICRMIYVYTKISRQLSCDVCCEFIVCIVIVSRWSINDCGFDYRRGDLIVIWLSIKACGVFIGAVSVFDCAWLIVCGDGCIGKTCRK